MRSERGSAAIAAVGVVVLGFVLMAGVAAVGQVVLARAKVVAAAEAGALAAAPVTFRPFGATGSPSLEADRLVRANGAVLVRCSCPYDSGYGSRTIVVTARLKTTVLGIREMSIEATAAAEFSPVALLGGWFKTEVAAARLPLTRRFVVGRQAAKGFLHPPRRVVPRERTGSDTLTIGKRQSTTRL